MEIYKDITFEAAHLLPNLPDDHKCRRLHGHSFKVRITINGPIKEKVGWVEDDIDKRDDLDLCDCCGNVIDKYPYYTTMPINCFT